MIVLRPRLGTFAAALALGACGPPDGPPQSENAEQASAIPNHNFGRRGESGGFEAICRYEILELPPVLTLADFTIEHGGFTCHPVQGPVLFVPERDGRCPRSDQLSLSPPEALSIEQASRGFYACMAMLQQSAEDETDVVTFRPRSSPEEIDRAFASFAFNLMALANHDALPVDHLLYSNNVVCVETSQPSVVVERVAASDIADTSVYVTETHRGVCREIGSRMTGHSWPEIGPRRESADQS